MSIEDKIVSLNDFKENRKLVDSDGTLYTGFYTDYYDLVNDQQGYFEEYYKDGKLNGLSTWWYENGQIECEGFFKDGTEIDDTRTELDENELPFSSNGPVAFIKNFCLTFFYILVGFKFSKYILDAWF